MDKDELKNRLTEEEYHVTQEKGTEIPFQNEFWDNYEEGSYSCKVCGQQLFASDTKLNSKEGPVGLRGWPAFDKALPGATIRVHDDSLGMSRTEILCSKCKAHLGHVFSDESAPSGEHFCTNSASLCFKAKKV
jgi:peptide-methionine (R)-S-oxide reductase